MKPCLSVLLILLLCSGLYAQSPNDVNEKLGQYCATDERHEHLLKTDTTYAAKVRRINSLQSKRTARQRTESATTIYYIPVVIHIIHDNGPENISDQQVIDGIKHLNDAYRHISPFDGVGGADIGIQFCLAIQDPLGNPTTGILRLQSDLTNVKIENDDALFELDRWDTRKYLNIWLVKEICLGAECRVNGYSSFAYQHGQYNDGLVIKALQFGRWANLSKIPIHEIGHYFNLFHTFGSCKNDDCTHDGDGICDTPPDRSTDEIPCGISMNSCTTDEDDHSLNNPFRPIALGGLGEQNDQTQNYMDYGNLDCINLFTEGQKVRMISTLLDIRNSLLYSTGCKTPCPFRISFNSSAPTVDVGNTLSFQNTSTGGDRYRWELDDVLLSTSTNVSYTFNVKGTYNLRLYASNADSSCLSSTFIPIRVIPPCTPPIASFYTSPFIRSHVIADLPISLISNSGGATNYKWKIDDILVSNSFYTNYAFHTPGVHKIKLLAYNFDIDCVDSTEMSVMVIPACPLSFTATAATIETGNTVSFTNTSVNAVHFSWYINNNEFSTETNTTYTFNEPGSYTVTLYGYNEDSTCGGSTLEYVKVLCRDFHASFDVPAGPFKQADYLHFTNTSLVPTTFIWKIDDVQFSTYRDLDYRFFTAGNHSIKLLAYNDNYTCVDSISSSIFVNPGRACIASLSASNQTINVAGTVYFYNSSEGPGFTNFIWKINGVEFAAPESTVVPYTFNEPGNYIIQLIGYTDDRACKDSMSTQLIVIDPNPPHENKVIIPNLITANGDGLNDTFKVTGLSQGYTLEVYNQWDAVVYKKEDYDNSFGADGLNSNIYFYNLYHPATGQSYRGWVHVVK
jgi:PKD repeat protein